MDPGTNEMEILRAPSAVHSISDVRETQLVSGKPTQRVVHYVCDTAPPPDRAGKYIMMALPHLGGGHRPLGARPAATVLFCLSVPAVVLIFFATELAALWRGDDSMGASWLSVFLAAAVSERPTTSGTAPVSFSADRTAAKDGGGVDLTWHASGRTAYNDLADVIGRPHGVPGFTFDPSGNWTDGESNWCNMPHVRREEYVRPPEEYELVYVELMHRHHKRTPYASNAFPVEPYRWDCDDQALFFYGQPLPTTTSAAAAQVYWRGQVSGLNPFMPPGWIGTCQFPQITSGGLEDSRRHGEDLYGVYHDLLGFLPGRGDENWRASVRFRATQNVITSQVAGMLVGGMWATTGSVPLEIQAAGVDSLEPQYPCPAASAAFAQLQSPTASPAWAAHLAAASPLFTRLDAVSGVPPDDAGFHRSLDHYFDNLSARQCHAKPLPCRIGGDGPTASQCVTQRLADEAYRFGHWEYAHVYRGDAASLAASAASIGVWVGELAAHLRAAAAGCAAGADDDDDEACTVRYRHSVAHDGSVSRLLGVLQLREMVWPGMGAEVVFELWRRRPSEAGGAGLLFVRVLFGGKVLRSASPALGVMDMVPLATLLAYFDGLVGEGASLVVGKCRGDVPPT